MSVFLPYRLVVAESRAAELEAELHTLRAENGRLRSALDRAKYALTKSSLSEAEAVGEAKRIIASALSQESAS